MTCVAACFHLCNLFGLPPFSNASVVVSASRNLYNMKLPYGTVPYRYRTGTVLYLIVRYRTSVPFELYRTVPVPYVYSIYYIPYGTVSLLYIALRIISLLIIPRPYIHPMRALYGTVRYPLLAVDRLLFTQ